MRYYSKTDQLLPMTIVTGGGGYIGKHILRELKEKAVSMDSQNKLPYDLAQRHLEVTGDYVVNGDRINLEQRIVYHCAGLVSVQESFDCPQLYWKKNFQDFATLLYGEKPKWIVFSSSAGVYAPMRAGAMREDSMIDPPSPYGMTKLACEKYLQECFPDRTTIFRYFNAAGGEEQHEPETHFIPNMILSYLKNLPVIIHGDGNQVRDFVHPQDLARAHIKAVGIPGIFNLGSGVGYSLNQILKRFQNIIGHHVNVRYCKPRPNDPRHLVADISKAKKILGWKPKIGIDEIIETSLRYLKGSYSERRVQRCMR